jgi:hypothetical protein
VLPTLGGYLNEGGFLNLPRFERFMETLSQYELEKFDDIYSGLFVVIIACQKNARLHGHKILIVLTFLSQTPSGWRGRRPRKIAMVLQRWNLRQVRLTNTVLMIFNRFYLAPVKKPYPYNKEKNKEKRLSGLSVFTELASSCYRNKLRKRNAGGYCSSTVFR